jgi:hypothetical protein
MPLKTKFIVILESKNKVTTEFLLGELAIKYKEIMVKINNTFILFVILLSSCFGASCEV